VANFYGTGIPGNAGILVEVNVNGDSCDVYGNILLEPYFVEPFQQNFSLLDMSPCIDAGDPELHFDPDNTIADIGAIFYDQSSWVKDQNQPYPVKFKLLSVYPNPFNPTTVIRFQLPVAGFVTLEIFDVNGRAVGARHAVPLQNAWHPPGTHEVTFDGSGLASGLYIYHLQAGDFNASGKMVLMK